MTNTAYTDSVRGIWTIENVLSGDECQALIGKSEQAGYEPATMNYFGGAVARPDIRNNDRVIWDDPLYAERLWAILSPHVPQSLGDRYAVGLNERFRLYRYDPGQKFAPHIDGSYRSPTGAQSMLTLLVYLNDGFEGGETDVDGVAISPQTGKALLFRHQLLHEGVEIRSGRKYVLRSDVMYL